MNGGPGAGARGAGLRSRGQDATSLHPVLGFKDSTIIAWFGLTDLDPTKHHLFNH